MKLKRIVLLLITPLLMGVTRIDTKAAQTISISSEQYGPYEIYQDDVTSSYKLISTFTKSVSTYEKISFTDIKTGNVRNIKTAAHTVPARSRLKVSITIPTSEFMGPNGMTMSVGCFNSDNNTRYFVYSGTIYPPGHENVNPLNYLNDGFTSKTIGISFPIRSLQETISFPNYNDYFLTDIYYRLPLDQFDISVSSRFSETPIGNCFLVLKDASRIFPNLFGVNGDITIALKVTKIDDIYRLSLKNSLYVNPSTMNMAYLPLSGYVATDNLYFPINQIDSVQGLNVTFTLRDFGNNKTNLSWTSTYYPTSNIIGQCNNSEYCIVGGVSQ